MNFWEHSIASQVALDGNIYEIAEIHPSDKSQVRLRPVEDWHGLPLPSWHFIQDLDWVPTVEEGMKILSNLGVEIFDKHVRFKNIMRDRPTSVEEVYNTLVEYRIDSMNLGHNLGTSF